MSGAEFTINAVNPCIWYADSDWMSRLDHPDHKRNLEERNIRDLRIMKAVLDCAVEHVNQALDQARKNS